MSKFQKGHIGWNKGKTGVYSVETLEKKRLAGLGRKHDVSTKKLLSIKTKKLWENPEYRSSMTAKLKAAHALRIGKVGANKGKKTWNFNKKLCFSEETIGKMRLSALGKRKGEKNGRWLGGKSFEPYSSDWTDTLKESIRQRDSYLCQVCFSSQEEGRAHAVHHIDYDKKNCNPLNLVTLCHSCHGKTTVGDRVFWKEYFVIGL